MPMKGKFFNIEADVVKEVVTLPLAKCHRVIAFVLAKKERVVLLCQEYCRFSSDWVSTV